MIVKIRLEAEGASFKEVIADIEQATKRLPPDCDDLQVHDEHYERVTDKLFRGRRVFGRGPKAASSGPFSPIAVTSGNTNPIYFNT